MGKVKEWMAEKRKTVKDFAAEEKEGLGGFPFSIFCVFVIVLFPFLLFYFCIIMPIWASVMTLWEARKLGFGKAYQKNFHKARYEKGESDRQWQQEKMENAPLLPEGKWKTFRDRKLWPDAYAVDRIAIYAAEGRTLLYVDDGVEDFVVPEGVVNIWHRCFACCYSLKKVTLPSSLRRIGNGAFFACVALREINVPESVTFLGNEVFADCTSLHSVALPSHTKELPPRLFDNCRKLDRFQLPMGVKKIGEESFRNCHSLVHLTLNDGLEKIYERAFENCRSLEGFIMPESVVFLKSGVFNGCHSLRKLHFSKQIKDFGGSCCHECWSLRDISMTKDERWQEYTKENWREFASKADPATSENPYPESCFWRMGDALYFGIPRLTTVCLIICFTKAEEFTIPCFVTNVKQEAFGTCRNLRTLRLSPLLRVGDDAWGNEKMTYSFIYNYWPQVEHVVFDEALNNPGYFYGLMA